MCTIQAHAVMRVCDRNKADTQLSYSLFALSLPTEVIILFIDDVLSCDFDIFQIFVGVGMRAQLVGKHVVANYSLLLIVVFWPP